LAWVNSLDVLPNALRTRIREILVEAVSDKFRLETVAWQVETVLQAHSHKAESVVEGQIREALDQFLEAEIPEELNLIVSHSIGSLLP